MIKGVNKQIIEVNNPDSIYFEKAVFYLRPNVRKLPEEVSREEASRYISKLGLEYTKKNRQIKRGKFIIYSIMAAFLAALILTLIIII